MYVLKAREYGAKVVSISGRDGYVYDPDGITTDEKIDFLLKSEVQMMLNLKIMLKNLVVNSMLVKNHGD